jgi:CRP-like cAMP-binding protein
MPARKAKSGAPAPLLSPVSWHNAATDRVEYEAGVKIYEQGQPALKILYLESGTVRLSVLSRTGKEAVVAVLNPGNFFGEGCLAGQTRRMGTAVSIDSSTVIAIEKQEMVRHLHADREFADRFMTHMLARNTRIEEDLIDQLFNSSEKRLARTLLLLAQYAEGDPAHSTLPRVSQETLAEMVGTTRQRVNFFMNKFRRLGFIEYNGELKINNALLTVVLRD